MRVLIDISHPAHVHFYRHIIASLEQNGHSSLVVARDKDVTHALLVRFSIPHVSVGRAGSTTRLGQAAELMTRDAAIVRAARDFRPHLILSRNPSGMQAARIVRTKGVFDTDDGRAAGMHFHLAARFAHVITSPDCIGEDYGRKHRRYPGYKALAYLHPDRFVPDPHVLSELEVHEGEPFSIVRFVDMRAAHDRGESGLAFQERCDVVELLQRFGRVFVSSEGALPEKFERVRLPIGPERMHDALAFAAMYVGDSQTMASEAAILGTPALHYSTWSGRLTYLVELEKRYGLLRSFDRSDTHSFLDTLRGWMEMDDLQAEWTRRRQRMLQDKCDVTSWYCGLLDELATRSKS